jgi:hypothetical protein
MNWNCTRWAADPGAVYSGERKGFGTRTWLATSKKAARVVELSMALIFHAVVPPTPSSCSAVHGPWRSDEEREEQCSKLVMGGEEVGRRAVSYLLVERDAGTDDTRNFQRRRNLNYKRKL